MTTIQVASTTTTGKTYRLSVTDEGQAVACTCPGHTYHGRCRHVDAHNGTPAPRPTVTLMSREERRAKREAASDAQAILAGSTVGLGSSEGWGNPLAALDELEDGWLS